MLQKKRYFLFYALVLFFFVAAPLLAAFALGYTVNFALVSIEKTGGIFLKSTRRGNIAVMLDGSLAKETSFFSRGALLTEISSGMHLVRIEKEGYYPWFKSVPIIEAQVTELRDIFLVPVPIHYATSTDTDKLLLNALSTNSKSPSIDTKGNLISSDKDSDIIASNINSFGMVRAGLLMVDKNGFLSFAKGDRIDVLTRPGFYLAKDAPIRFVESPKGEIAIIDSSGGLFLLTQDNTLHILGGEARNAAFDSGGEKLLIQKEQAVEVLWREDNTYQPFQKKGNREALLTVDILNDSIKNAHWYYGDNAHVIIHARNGIYLTEIDGRGGRNTVELVNASVDEIITTPKDPEAVFFRKGNDVYRIEL